MQEHGQTQGSAVALRRLTAGGERGAAQADSLPVRSSPRADHGQTEGPPAGPERCCDALRTGRIRKPSRRIFSRSTSGAMCSGGAVAAMSPSIAIYMDRAFGFWTRGTNNALQARCCGCSHRWDLHSMREVLFTD